VEAALEELDEVLTRHALHARRLVVVAAELPLGDAVDALHLLLLAELLAVVRGLAPAGLAVLAGRIGAPLVSTLVGVAAVALQEELHVLAAAEAADGSDVTCHFSNDLESNAAALGRPAAVVRDRGDVADEADLEARRLQRAQRRLAARARPLHVDGD